MPQGARSEAEAYEALEALRWPGGPVCPHCRGERTYFLRPRNGAARPSGAKRRPSERRVWKCAACRRQFSVLTGTVIQGTKVPVRVWLSVLLAMCAGQGGVSAREIERSHGVSPATAFAMLQRVKEAMAREPLASALPTATGEQAMAPTRDREARPVDDLVLVVHRDRAASRSAPAPSALSVFVRRARRSARAAPRR